MLDYVFYAALGVAVAALAIGLVWRRRRVQAAKAVSGLYPHW